MRSPRILIVAGEASGDAHAAGLVQAVRAARPDVRFTAVGGPALAAAGAEMVADSRELAVIGIVEVLGRLPRVLRLLRRLDGMIRRDPPDLFVPVDAPEFNLRVARTAARAGVPVVYFIAPQLWAWRAGRVDALRRHVRELLALFPFEQPWFAARGVATSYVGHPLVEAARARCAPLTPVRAAPRMGLLLPGSRRGEVARHLPILSAAVTRLAATYPRLRWKLRMAAELSEEEYRRRPLAEEVELTRAPIFDLAAEADVAVAASGTASFEVALMGTPLLVVYRLHPLTWQLARRVVRVPFVSMANLAAGRAIVPELLQQRLTAVGVADALSTLLGDAARREHMRRELLDLRERFGPPGAYARAAERVLTHLDAARSRA